MIVQHAGQKRKRTGQLCFCCRSLHDSPKAVLINDFTAFGIQQFIMPGKFAANDFGQLFQGFRPGFTFDILEGYKDYRIFPLIRLILFALSPYGFIPEIDGRILLRFFKEGTQHIHIQGFSETARSGEK